MSTNNASIAYININNVLSEVFVSAYISDYVPYFRLFGLQILPMCIVLFSMVYCVLTVTRPTSSSSDERKFTEYSTLNNCYDLCNYDAIYIWGIPNHIGACAQNIR